MFEYVHLTLLVLDGYLVKDLDAKWIEIERKCEQARENKKKRELQKANITVTTTLIAEKKDKSNCFIATATLGNENHPIIIDLRNFRDNWLLKRSWGRTFIKFYYKNGPKTAKVISKNSIARIIILWTLIKPVHYITRKLK